MLSSIQILIKKVLKNWFFPAFGQILLGFGECFFYSNSNGKRIENLIFPAFGKISVLLKVFSIQILI